MAVLMFVGNHVFMRYLSDDGVGAFGVSCYYMPFVFMIGNAIAQSAQPIISYNFGINNQVRIRSAFHISLLTAFICGAIATAAFTLCPKLLVGLFLNLDNQAAQIAVHGFPLLGTAFIFFVLNLTVIGYCQSIEQVRKATIYALLRGLVFMVPSFVFLPKLLGINGIWLALCLSEVMTALTILITSRTGVESRIA
jgi:Na+-driven multidrug efflux pump